MDRFTCICMNLELYYTRIRCSVTCLPALRIYTRKNMQIAYSKENICNFVEEGTFSYMMYCVARPCRKMVCFIHIKGVCIQLKILYTEIKMCQQINKNIRTQRMQQLYIRYLSKKCYKN